MWADQVAIGGNVVRQLLVHEHHELEVSQLDGEEIVSGPFGQWRVRRGVTLGSEDPLTAILPVVGDGRGPIKWRGSKAPISPDDVQASYANAIAFTSHEQPHSLRRPQIAALHSIVGYQASGLTDPGIVVMPTGTGKTETMLAWMVAERPSRVLVIVPSNALRDQIAGKFETLGVLQKEGIVSPHALRPSVAKLEHRLDDIAQAHALVEAAGVVVATPNAIHANVPEVREALLAGFSHLLVDEAHHSPAETWGEIIRAFAGKPTLLFTATPFRRDGRTLPGRVIFRFPLREAQLEGYFSPIDFTAVLDLDDDDEPLVKAAIARLRADIDAGYEHILLARVDKKSRADEIHALYERLAPDLAPAVLYDSLSVAKRREAFDAIREGTSRVIVCVDMLGEGFDLPTLKVGAFHDRHQSLSPMIQLIGRLARTVSPRPIGGASVFVRQDPKDVLSPLRFLLREDPDWNTVLSDITERASAKADEVSAFESSFFDSPADVPVGLLEPKMSAIAYLATGESWNPSAALKVYPGGVLDETVSISADSNVAWFVLESADRLRWGVVPSLRPTSYTLVVMHLDRGRGLLYVHGSDTKRDYDDLVKAVLELDDDPGRVNGYNSFRVFGGLERLVPTNIGLLDARDRDKRFSMHVGSDVETALTEAEKTHKANTHVAARAFEDGERVSIAASLSGRFWSPRSAENLADWVAWCKQQGAKLTNSSIDVHSLFRDMIIPVDVRARPAYVFLAMEWPWELYTGTGTASRLLHDGKDGLWLTDADLRIDDYRNSGPVKFSVVATAWEAAYEATFGETGAHFVPCGDEKVDVVNGRGGTTPLSVWLNKHKPTFLLEGDRMITGDDRLLEPRTNLAPYSRDKLSGVDWIANGVDIRVESQGVDRRADSIQAFMVKHLTQSQAFDVLIDDDRAGEAADLVGLRIDRGDLHVTLVHCKYSSRDTAGGRVADLYEVCGQAMRGARWRDGGAMPLLEHLERRTKAYERRTGGTAFEIGDRAMLYKIRQQAHHLFPRITTIVVQPGVSIASSTDEQLRLLAGAENYVGAVTKGGFKVLCSE